MSDYMNMYALHNCICICTVVKTVVIVALIVVRASSIESFEWLNQGINHSVVELCGMVTGQTRRFFVMLYKILQYFRKIIFKKSLF